MAGAGEFFESILGKADHRHAVVIVGDVAGGAPEIAGTRSPGPGSLHAPIANAEDDGAAGLRDGIPKFRVLHGGLQAFRVAPIDFDVIDAPGGVGFDVLRFVLVAAGTLLAGHAAGVGVYTELQTLGMDVIGEWLHAVGEALGVNDDAAVGGAADLPTVVDVHELIAGIFHASGDHGVGNFANQLVADVAAELVPTVPAHGRRGGYCGSGLGLRRLRSDGVG